MQTITQKKKLSKGTWALIGLIIVAIIAVVVLSIFPLDDPYIKLNFLTDDMNAENGPGLLVGYAIFGSNSWINAALIIVGPFVIGMIFFWAIQRWIVGQKVTVAAAGQSVYTPQTGASTGTQSGTSTEVS